LLLMFPILWIALWFLAPQAVVRAPSRASIGGTVVRAGASVIAVGQQLPEARVELKPGNASVYTNADGVFTFRNLVPGRYTISVTRDGFIPQDEERSITLSAGQVVQDLVLPMIPAPVLIGKVFDPHGESLAAALVRAYVREYTPFGTQLKIVKKGMTNDLGEF